MYDFLPLPDSSSIESCKRIDNMDSLSVSYYTKFYMERENIYNSIGRYGNKIYMSLAERGKMIQLDPYKLLVRGWYGPEPSLIISNANTYNSGYIFGNTIKKLFYSSLQDDELYSVDSYIKCKIYNDDNYASTGFLKKNNFQVVGGIRETSDNYLVGFGWEGICLSKLVLKPQKHFHSFSICEKNKVLNFIWFLALQSYCFFSNRRLILLDPLTCYLADDNHFFFYDPLQSCNMNMSDIRKIVTAYGLPLESSLSNEFYIFLALVVRFHDFKYLVSREFADYVLNDDAKNKPYGEFITPLDRQLKETITSSYDNSTFHLKVMEGRGKCEKYSTHLYFNESDSSIVLRHYNMTNRLDSTILDYVCLLEKLDQVSFGITMDKCQVNFIKGIEKKIANSNRSILLSERSGLLDKDKFTTTPGFYDRFMVAISSNFFILDSFMKTDGDLPRDDLGRDFFSHKDVVESGSSFPLTPMYTRLNEKTGLTDFVSPNILSAQFMTKEQLPYISFVDFTLTDEPRAVTENKDSNDNDDFTRVIGNTITKFVTDIDHKTSSRLLCRKSKEGNYSIIQFFVDKVGFTYGYIFEKMRMSKHWAESRNLKYFKDKILYYENCNSIQAGMISSELNINGDMRVGKKCRNSLEYVGYITPLFYNIGPDNCVKRICDYKFDEKHLNKNDLLDVYINDTIVTKRDNYMKILNKRFGDSLFKNCLRNILVTYICFTDYNGKRNVEIDKNIVCKIKKLSNMEKKVDEEINAMNIFNIENRDIHLLEFNDKYRGLKLKVFALDLDTF